MAEGAGVWQPQQAIGGIMQKVLDGTRWMDAFDHSPRDDQTIGGLLDIWRIAREHQNAGRRWIPWSNVRGLEPEREGMRLGYSAMVAGAPYAIANVEPYVDEGFWAHKGANTTKNIERFFHGFRRAARGRVKLRLWVDARPWQLTLDRGMGLGEWLRIGGSLIDGVLPEIYWTDFDTTPAQAIHDALTLLDSYDVKRPQVYPTFPGDAADGEMNLALLLAYLESTSRPNVWQRVNLRPEAAIEIAQFPTLAKWESQE